MVVRLNVDDGSGDGRQAFREGSLWWSVRAHSLARVYLYTSSIRRCIITLSGAVVVLLSIVACALRLLSHQISVQDPGLHMP